MKSHNAKPGGCVLLAAIVSGAANAFLSAGVHSLFFALLPLLAFAVGHASSWRRGLLNGFLLFLSYTFGMSLLWTGGGPNLLYPLPYVAAFVTGGFTIPLIGALSPMVRRSARSPAPVVALVVLVGVVGWCGYLALPRYGHYYQVVINSTEDLDNLEVYLPVSTVSGAASRDLYAQPFREAPPGALTEEFTLELVETEHGTMLKLTIPDLRKDDVPEPRYTANIIFWQRSAPQQVIRLTPRRNATPINTVAWQRRFGPIKTAESILVERFEAPVKIAADKLALVKLTIWNRTDRGEAVNFAYSKSDSYTELVSIDLRTDSRWTSVPGEATTVMRISGVSD